MKKRKKKNQSQIKSIIFDVGGVLQISKQPEKLVKDKYLKTLPKNCKHRHKGVHEYISGKLGISIDQWFDSIDTTYADSIIGRISENKVVSIISTNLQIQKNKLKKIVINAYKKNFKFNKQLFKQALKLKKLGYKIAILSDQWHLSKKALINPKITKVFNPVLISCDIGIRKPNSQIYRLILKKLNLSARNCLFIDNQKWNITPARKIGFQTILFKNNKQLFKQLSKKIK
jgi:epoxide hydrolase-like predicted phosphatase